jgi:hypothetical protein
MTTVDAEKTVKTAPLCRSEKWSIWAVYNAIRSGAVAPPAKDESGDFQWGAADIARLREYLAASRARRERARGSCQAV